MKNRIARAFVASFTVFALTTFTLPSLAPAQSSSSRERVFNRVLTAGKSFSVTSNGCGLAVTNQTAARLNVTCQRKTRVITGPARIELELNEYGIVRAKDCVLSVTDERPGYVNVRCVEPEPARIFAGSVNCDAEGRSIKPRVWKKTRIVLDRAVTPVKSAASGSAKVIPAVQVGGLAGSLVDEQRSVMTVQSSGGNGGRGGLFLESLDFSVLSDPESPDFPEIPRFSETGQWNLGVDGKGRVTLQGRSKARLRGGRNGFEATCRWNLSAAKEPIGPISKKMIEKLFDDVSPPAAGAESSAGVGSSSITGCGTVYNVTTDYQYVAGALFDFVPGASAVLQIGAVASSIAGTEKGNACLASTLDNINEQLAIQAYEIQQLQTYLGLATNVFYYDWYQTQLALEDIDVKGWTDSLGLVSPRGAEPGAFGSFMSTGLGLWDSFLNPAAGAITDPEQLALSYSISDLDLIRSQIVAGEIAGFQEWVNDFSGTEPVLPAPTCTSNCSVTVAPDSGSYLIKMYAQLFKTLQAEINVLLSPAQTFSTTVNRNIVPLYDQYNSMLVNFYQQAVVGLQQALTMEWLVNEINYYRGSGSIDKTQLPSWGEVAGTLYKYSNRSASAEAAAYNTAQENLLKLYAGRINQLYLNTLNYVVTDIPLAPQKYPSTPISFSVAGKTYTEAPIDYSGEVGKSLPTDTTGTSSNPAAPDQGRTPLSLVPPVISGDWRSRAALYQFSGVADVSACISSLDAYNRSKGPDGGTVAEWLADPTACPTIFRLPAGVSPSQGLYDGNTLTLYTNVNPIFSSSIGPIVLTGTMTNNLKFCDPTSPSVGWYVPTGAAVGNAAGMVAGTQYLNCGRWYTPGKNSCGLPRANCPPSASALYTVTGMYHIEPSVADTSMGCTDNLQIGTNKNKYPYILTLTDSLPSDMKSCSVAVPTVSGSGTTYTPNFTNSRTESVSFETGGAGCSIGFIGSGISNALPKERDLDAANIGLRLMNYTDSGSQGHASGWMLPLRIESYCQTNGWGTHPWTDVNVYAGLIADTGFTCTMIMGSIPDDPLLFHEFNCTILDGTTYNFQLNPAGALRLDIRVVQ